MLRQLQLEEEKTESEAPKRGGVTASRLETFTFYPALPLPSTTPFRSSVLSFFPPPLLTFYNPIRRFRLLIVREPLCFKRRQGRERGLRDRQSRNRSQIASLFCRKFHVAFRLGEFELNGIFWKVHGTLVLRESL